jgi:hypothetical protein
MAISTDIGIHDIYLGIHVSHRDTYHCIGINGNASSHNEDVMSSHMPHGPLICILLAQMDTLLHIHALFATLLPNEGAINAFEIVCAHYRGDYT